CVITPSSSILSFSIFGPLLRPDLFGEFMQLPRGQSELLRWFGTEPNRTVNPKLGTIVRLCEHAYKNPG
ncbi:MAG TPA: hypothetical protein PK710_24730, partial [Polyangiaceae bacterium]|nr:hypothetical protein [Polyangiaceae bacterium]